MTNVDVMMWSMQCGGARECAGLGHAPLHPTQLTSASGHAPLSVLSIHSVRCICSVGAHVRDAAAYVCWAVARAYAPQTLAPILTFLAPHLLVVACFDREVHVLRLQGPVPLCVWDVVHAGAVWKGFPSRQMLVVCTGLARLRVLVGLTQAAEGSTLLQQALSMCLLCTWMQNCTAGMLAGCACTCSAGL